MIMTQPKPFQIEQNQITKLAVQVFFNQDTGSFKRPILVRR